MELLTNRFGTISVAPDDVITFTQPIIGFQEFRRFVVLPGPDKSELKWLQSTESGELAFLLMDPRSVMPGYEVKLAQHELSELAVNGANELDVYTLLVVPQDPSKIRTNLKAPILINPKHKLGKQTVLDKCDYPIQHFLSKSEDDQSREVSNARSNA
jgi:flagellar assembly factor FliW